MSEEPLYPDYLDPENGGAQQRAMVSEIVRLRAALEEYGDHKYSCQMLGPVDSPLICTCGYEQALKNPEDKWKR